MWEAALWEAAWKWEEVAEGLVERETSSKRTMRLVCLPTYIFIKNKIIGDECSALDRYQVFQR